MNEDRIEAVLRREMRMAELTPEERKIALARLSEPYRAPNPAVEAAYAALPSTAGATERRRLREQQTDLERQTKLAEEIMVEDADVLRALAGGAREP